LAFPAADAALATRFSPPVLLDTGNNPFRVVAADLNADGKPDLATADNGAFGLCRARPG
jgi:hypothetical protein